MCLLTYYLICQLVKHFFYSIILGYVFKEIYETYFRLKISHVIETQSYNIALKWEKSALKFIENIRKQANEQKKSLFRSICTIMQQSPELPLK